MKKGFLISTLSIGLIILGLITYSWIKPSRVRKALPSSAASISEYYKSYSMNDFTRVLKARLPAKDYPIFVQNLNLIEKYDPNKHDTDDYYALTTGLEDGMPDWWDEPTSLTNCYFQYIPNDEFLIRVKWENGYVYFVASQW